MHRLCSEMQATGAEDADQSVDDQIDGHDVVQLPGDREDEDAGGKGCKRAEQQGNVQVLVLQQVDESCVTRSDAEQGRRD